MGVQALTHAHVLERLPHLVLKEAGDFVEVLVGDLRELVGELHEVVRRGLQRLKLRRHHLVRLHQHALHLADDLADEPVAGVVAELVRRRHHLPEPADEAVILLVVRDHRPQRYHAVPDVRLQRLQRVHDGRQRGADELLDPGVVVRPGEDLGVVLQGLAEAAPHLEEVVGLLLQGGKDDKHGLRDVLVVAQLQPRLRNPGLRRRRRCRCRCRRRSSGGGRSGRSGFRRCSFRRCSGCGGHRGCGCRCNLDLRHQADLPASRTQCRIRGPRDRRVGDHPIRAVDAAVRLSVNRQEVDLRLGGKVHDAEGHGVARRHADRAGLVVPVGLRVVWTHGAAIRVHGAVAVRDSHHAAHVRHRRRLRGPRARADLEARATAGVIGEPGDVVDGDDALWAVGPAEAHAVHEEHVVAPLGVEAHHLQRAHGVDVHANNAAPCGRVDSWVVRAQEATCTVDRAQAALHSEEGAVLGPALRGDLGGADLPAVVLQAVVRRPGDLAVWDHSLGTMGAAVIPVVHREGVVHLLGLEVHHVQRRAACRVDGASGIRVIRLRVVRAHHTAIPSHGAEPRDHSEVRALLLGVLRHLRAVGRGADLEARAHDREVREPQHVLHGIDTHRPAVAAVVHPVHDKNVRSLLRVEVNHLHGPRGVRIDGDDALFAHRVVPGVVGAQQAAFRVHRAAAHHHSESTRGRGRGLWCCLPRRHLRPRPLEHGLPQALAVLKDGALEKELQVRPPGGQVLLARALLGQQGPGGAPGPLQEALLDGPEVGVVDEPRGAGGALERVEGGIEPLLHLHLPCRRLAERGWHRKA
mmetsp:Transcript_85117/g.258319  ORF Transcript_85117/g.258319 Transcript_85117/m.258319 type:complete len:806 (+) Transcript_85117:660-3077(+)